MIEPTSYHNKLEGKSNAHLITFNDGNDYVVKFFQSGFEKTLPNEWIGYCLARYLQMPVPFGQIVDIPVDFLANASVYDQGQVNSTPSQFASLYIPNCVDGHHVSDISSITNSGELAQIILFDYWLGNKDRTRKNILFQEKGEGVFTLWAIDHAEVFGGFNWGLADLQNLPEEVMKSTAHRMLAKFIKSEEEFYEQLQVIQSIPILLMEEIVELIPEEWGVTKEEKKAIVTTLLYRRDRVLPRVVKRIIEKIYRPARNQ